jgi:hypothetical protein
MCDWSLVDVICSDCRKLANRKAAAPTSSEALRRTGSVDQSAEAEDDVETAELAPDLGGESLPGAQGAAELSPPTPPPPISGMSGRCASSINP